MRGLPVRTALAAAVLALLTSGCGDDDARPTADPTSASPSGPSTEPSPPPALPAYFLPRARDLPTRAGSGPWRQADRPDDPVVGCQPPGTLGALEVIQRSYEVRVGPSDGLPGGKDVTAEARITVLQYGSTEEGEAAEAAVLGWITDCDEPTAWWFPRRGATREGDLVETQAGTYATWTYLARDVCTDCDAQWFERMGVLADLGRMVVVSYREIGGPLEPEGLDATMQDLMLQAAGRSMPG